MLLLVPSRCILRLLLHVLLLRVLLRLHLLHVLLLILRLRVLLRVLLLIQCLLVLLHLELPPLHRGLLVPNRLLFLIPHLILLCHRHIRSLLFVR